VIAASSARRAGRGLRPSPPLDPRQQRHHHPPKHDGRHLRLQGQPRHHPRRLRRLEQLQPHSHGSDSPEAAERELTLFFGKGEVLSFPRAIEGWVYDMSGGKAE